MGDEAGVCGTLVCAWCVNGAGLAVPETEDDEECEL